MTLNWFSPQLHRGNSVQQPVSSFDQEQSDHWEVLADMAYYQELAMQEELDEDDMPMVWSQDQPSECQQTNTTQSEDCT